MRELMKKYKYSSINSFLGAVGEGTVDINDIKAFIIAQNSPGGDAQARPDEVTVKDWKGNKSSDDILVLNAKDVKGLDYRMAKCCNPVFGDDVFGFVTRGEGIKIHRITCPNAARLLDRYPYRIQRVVWSETPCSGDFLCTLKILADMDFAVMSKIMEVVGNFKASIRSFNVGEDHRNGCYDISARILVPSNMELDKVISQIAALKHVIKVKRV